MDMAGNAREWTNTRWGTDPLEAHYAYPYNPAIDGRENREPAPDMCRVLRGGAYGVPAGTCAVPPVRQQRSISAWLMAGSAW